jgi:hypothetical protein
MLLLRNYKARALTIVSLDGEPGKGLESLIVQELRGFDVWLGRVTDLLKIYTANPV